VSGIALNPAVASSRARPAGRSLQLPGLPHCHPFLGEPVREGDEWRSRSPSCFLDGRGATADRRAPAPPPGSLGCSARCHGGNAGPAVAVAMSTSAARRACPTIWAIRSTARSAPASAAVRDGWDDDPFERSSPRPTPLNSACLP
jgi:hypothetical protein